MCQYMCYCWVTLYDKIPPYAYSTCLPFKHLFKNFYFIYILSPNHLMLRILLLFTENETPTSMCPYIQCNINCNGKTMNKTIDEDKDDASDSGWSLKKIIAEGIQPRQVTHKPFYHSPLHVLRHPLQEHHTCLINESPLQYQEGLQNKWSLNTLRPNPKTTILTNFHRML